MSLCCSVVGLDISLFKTIHHFSYNIYFLLLESFPSEVLSLKAN